MGRWGAPPSEARFPLEKTLHTAPVEVSAGRIGTGFSLCLKLNWEPVLPFSNHPRVAPQKSKDRRETAAVDGLGLMGLNTPN